MRSLKKIIFLTKIIFFFIIFLLVKCIFIVRYKQHRNNNMIYYTSIIKPITENTKIISENKNLNEELIDMLKTRLDFLDQRNFY